MTQIINTSGVNGAATDFSSLLPVIAVDSNGQYLELATSSGISAAYLPLAGGVLTGTLELANGVNILPILSGNSNLGSATKPFRTVYADNMIDSSGVSAFIPSIPTSTQNALVTWDSTSGDAVKNNSTWILNGDILDVPVNAFIQNTNGANFYLHSVTPSLSSSDVIVGTNIRLQNAGVDYSSYFSLTNSTGEIQSKVTNTNTNASTTFDIRAGGVYINGNIVLREVYGETPAGLINGSNNVFYLSQTPATQPRIFKNGLRMVSPDDFSVVALSGISFVSAPVSGSKIVADYQVTF